MINEIRAGMSAFSSVVSMAIGDSCSRMAKRVGELALAISEGFKNSRLGKPAVAKMVELEGRVKLYFKSKAQKSTNSVSSRIDASGDKIVTLNKFSPDNTIDSFLDLAFSVDTTNSLLDLDGEEEEDLFAKPNENNSVVGEIHLENLPDGD